MTKLLHVTNISPEIYNPTKFGDPPSVDLEDKYFVP